MKLTPMSPKQQCLLFILAIQQSGNQFPYSHDNSLQQFQKLWVEDLSGNDKENLSQPYHKSTRVNSITTNKRVERLFANESSGSKRAEE